MPLFVTCAVSSSDDGNLLCGFCKCFLLPSVYTASIHKRRASKVSHSTSTIHYSVLRTAILSVFGPVDICSFTGSRLCKSTVQDIRSARTFHRPMAAGSSVVAHAFV